MDRPIRAALYRRLNGWTAVAGVSGLALMMCLSAPGHSLCAQGVSTSSIAGTVRSAGGGLVDDARVEIVIRALAALAEIRAISDTRTAEQVSIAQTWATPTAPFTAGTLNVIVDDLIVEHRRTEREAARILA